MENYMMEKRLRIKKCSPSLNASYRNDDPYLEVAASPQECAAKNMLFEVSDNDNSRISSKNLKINEWFKVQPKAMLESPFSSVKQLKSQYKSVYISAANDNKMRTQTTQERNLELSVIPHLKSHLQKLQSPKKATNQEKKKEKMRYNQLRLDENCEFNEVRTTVVTPNHFTRSKNTSSYKKTKKNPFVNNFTYKRTRQLRSRQKTQFEFRDIGMKIELIKEARRNRTLRKLLF